MQTYIHVYIRYIHTYIHAYIHTYMHACPVGGLGPRKPCEVLPPDLRTRSPNNPGEFPDDLNVMYKARPDGRFHRVLFRKDVGERVTSKICEISQFW